MSVDAGDELTAASFRLGVFGDTHAGKTVYLAALLWCAKTGRLPPRVTNVRPADNESAAYLGVRVASLDAGQWPAGTLDARELRLLVDTDRGTVAVDTSDTRGGEFAAAGYGGTREDLARFVRERFAGCSAYLILVDPGPIKFALASAAPAAVASQTQAVSPTAAEVAGAGPDVEAAIEARRESERRTLGVLPLLEVLRRRSWRFAVFHPPTAIVFTKCDAHPDVAEDPAGFAREHMRPAWQYLAEHAPGAHRFFAASAAGPADRETGFPPRPLDPVGVVEPLMWCADAHARRSRRVRGSLCAAAAALLLAAYAVLLYLPDRQAIARVRASIPPAGDAQLAEAYREASSWQGASRFALTHPRDRTRVLREVVAAARARLDEQLAARRGADGTLRTVDDYLAAKGLIDAFTADYPGTEQAVAADAWLGAQREILAARAVAAMGRFAGAADERRFDQARQEYDRVATTTQDAAAAACERRLSARVVHLEAHAVWQMFLERPADVDAVREACARAEQCLATRPDHDLGDQQFVQLVRRAYDDLKRRGTTRTLRCVVEKDGDLANRTVDCVVTVAGRKPAMATDSIPVAVDDQSHPGRYEAAVVNDIKIDLLADPMLRVDLTAHNYLPNAYGHLDLGPASAVARELGERLSLATDRNGTYGLRFTSDDGLAQTFDLLGQIRAAGERLFGGGGGG